MSKLHINGLKKCNKAKEFVQTGLNVDKNTQFDIVPMRKSALKMIVKKEKNKRKKGHVYLPKHGKIIQGWNTFRPLEGLQEVQGSQNIAKRCLDKFHRRMAQLQSNELIVPSTIMNSLKEIEQFGISRSEWDN